MCALLHTCPPAHLYTCTPPRLARLAILEAFGLQPMALALHASAVVNMLQHDSWQVRREATKVLGEL